MTMTDGEIVASYRQAKLPLKQIGILADLNQCGKKEIVEILREAGCELPGNYAKKPQKEPEAGPAPNLSRMYGDPLFTERGRIGELAGVIAAGDPAYWPDLQYMLMATEELEIRLKAILSWKTDHELATKEAE